MKPKLNQEVYTITEQVYQYADSDFYIIPEIAAYLGEHSFVVGDPQDKIPCEWYYDDFGKEWFTTMAAAKEYAEKKAKKKLKWYRWSNGMYSNLQEEDY